MFAILIAASIILTNLLTAYCTLWWAGRKAEVMLMEARSKHQACVDSIMTSREREMRDARRLHLPREDAGPAAVIHTGIPRLKPRKL